MNKKEYGKQILVLFLLWGGMLLLCSVAQVLLSRIVDTQNTGILLAEQAVMSVLMFGFPVWMLIKLYKYPTKDFLKIDFSGKKIKIAVAAAVISLLLLPIVEVITEWNSNWHFGAALQEFENSLRRASEVTEALMSRILMVSNLGSFVTNLFVIALVPAVVEELFFRCGLQQLLAKCTKNTHVAILFTAVIFSIAHGDMFGFVPRFLLGLILGYLFYYSQSLLVNMTFHFVNNATVVVVCSMYGTGILSGDFSQPIGFDLATTIMCTIAAITLIVVTLYDARKTENN